MANHLKLLFSALLFSIPVAALAENGVADPTRPPAAFSEVTNQEASQNASVPYLQSVLLPKQGRPVAIISGHQVALGERYGESRLIKLSENEAVLEGPSGIERLQLTPDVGNKTVHIKKSRKTAAVNAQSRSKP